MMVILRSEATKDPYAAEEILRERARLRAL
jgi:hypothetical protein